nr:hypothetical protein [uncultured Phocaeicola sp.]
MAKIHKLIKDGQTIYPATTTDAVVHPTSRKSLSFELIKLNNEISLLQGESTEAFIKNDMILLSDNIKENSILSDTGQIMEFRDIKICSTKVKKGDAIYINIMDKLAEVYGVFAIYVNDSVVYLQKGGDAYNGYGKILKINIDCIIKYSIRNNEFDKGGGLFKITKTDIVELVQPLVLKIDNIDNKIDNIDNKIKDKKYIPISVHEKSLQGIYDTSGDIIMSPLRYHSIYPAEPNTSFLINTDTGLANGTISFWYSITFLDNQKNVISGITDKECATNILNNFEVKTPENTSYIAISEANTQTNSQLTKLKYIDKDIAFKDDIPVITKKEVLWLGTSIPEGCPYPQNACNKLRNVCYNKALGSSGIILNSGVLGNDRDGKDLSESTEEKIKRYQLHIGDGTDGTITQDRYSKMMNWGYDKLLLPYINGNIASCDIVVFDHGYNDRGAISGELVNSFDSLDLSIDKEPEEYDRSTFIGAFCFLINQIYRVNPNIKIIICSYLENKTGSPEFPNDIRGKKGYLICSLLEKIAKHFNFPYLNMCDFNGFTLEFIPNTSNYISDYNSRYGTDYTVINYTGKKNNKNNISLFQYYCPDGVHPHTDKSGRSTLRLTESITKLLENL